MASRQVTLSSTKLGWYGPLYRQKVEDKKGAKGKEPQLTRPAWPGFAHVTPLKIDDVSTVWLARHLAGFYLVQIDTGSLGLREGPSQSNDSS
jgi:hypothetical protein